MKNIVIALLLISLCSISVVAATSEKLLITLTTDKQVYRTTDPIAVALTVSNQDNQTYQAIFSSGKKYDFYLFDESGKEIWRWSQDKMFSQAFSKFNIEPDQPKTFVIIFNQLLASGEKLKPGKYQLIGVMATTEREFRSKKAEIEIR